MDLILCRLRHNRVSLGFYLAHIHQALGPNPKVQFFISFLHVQSPWLASSVCSLEVMT